MASVQPRRYDPLLRAAPARGGDDQEHAAEDPRTGHRLAVFLRAEEGAEGLTRFVPRAVAGLAVACVLSVTMPALAHQAGRDARLPTIGAAPPFALTTADGGRLALAD